MNAIAIVARAVHWMFKIADWVEDIRETIRNVRSDIGKLTESV